MSRDRYTRALPGHHYLDADPANLTAYLQSQGVLRAKGLFRKAGTVTTAETLDGGNMNFVARAHLAGATHGPSVIVKQSRPWVERYPDIAAPVTRTRAEATYFSLVAPVPGLADHTPQLLHHDGANHVLVLEDLGAASDLSDVYQGTPFDRTLGDGRRVVETCMTYLTRLHIYFRQNPPARRLTNKAMRQLNHEHIFDLPFRDDTTVVDEVLRKRAHALGQRYLDLKAPGTLLHGDFYPGSFLVASRQNGLQLYVIDPEFCFTGPPEFDFGVFVAHLYLSGNAALVGSARAFYQVSLDEQLWRGLAGVEILRRLLGVAQLPLGESIDRAALLQIGRKLMLMDTV